MDRLLEEQTVGCRDAGGRISAVAWTSAACGRSAEAVTDMRTRRRRGDGRRPCYPRTSTARRPQLQRNLDGQTLSRVDATFVAQPAAAAAPPPQDETAAVMTEATDVEDFLRAQHNETLFFAVEESRTRLVRATAESFARSLDAEWMATKRELQDAWGAAVTADPSASVLATPSRSRIAGVSTLRPMQQTPLQQQSLQMSMSALGSNSIATVMVEQQGVDRALLVSVVAVLQQQLQQQDRQTPLPGGAVCRSQNS